MLSNSYIKYILIILLGLTTFVSAQTKQWRLIWEDPNNPDSVTVDHYKIYRAIGNNPSSAVLVGARTGTEFIDYIDDSDPDSVHRGYYIYYWVTAVSSEGLESDFSDHGRGRLPKIEGIPSPLSLHPDEILSFNLTDNVKFPTYYKLSLKWNVHNRDSTQWITPFYAIKLQPGTNDSTFLNIKQLKPANHDEYSFWLFCSTTPDSFYDQYLIQLNPYFSFDINLPDYSFQIKDELEIDLRNPDIFSDNISDPATLLWNMEFPENRLDTTFSYSDGKLKFRAKDENSSQNVGTFNVYFNVKDTSNRYFGKDSIRITISSILTVDETIDYPSDLASDVPTRITLSEFLNENTYDSDFLDWDLLDKSTGIDIDTSAWENLSSSVTIGINAGWDEEQDDFARFRVTDPSGNSKEFRMNFVIIDADNFPPSILIPQNLQIWRNDSLVIQLNDTVSVQDNEPSDSLNWKISLVQGELSVDTSAQNKTIVIRPFANSIEGGSLQFIVTDPKSNSDTSVVNFSIKHLVVEDNLSLDEIVVYQSFPSVELDALVSQPDSSEMERLTWSVQTASPNLLISNARLNDRVLESRPRPYWYGEDFIVLQSHIPNIDTAFTTITFVVDFPDSIILIEDVVRWTYEQSEFEDFHLDSLLINPIAAKHDSIVWTISKPGNKFEFSLNANDNKTLMAEISDVDLIDNRTIRDTVEVTATYPHLDTLTTRLFYEIRYRQQMDISDGGELNMIEDDSFTFPLNHLVVEPPPLSYDEIFWNILHLGQHIQASYIENDTLMVIPENNFAGSDSLEVHAYIPDVGRDTTKIIVLIEARNDNPQFVTEFRETFSDTLIQEYLGTEYFELVDFDTGAIVVDPDPGTNYEDLDWSGSKYDSTLVRLELSGIKDRIFRFIILDPSMEFTTSCMLTVKDQTFVGDSLTLRLQLKSGEENFSNLTAGNFGSSEFVYITWAANYSADGRVIYSTDSSFTETRNCSLDSMSSKSNLRYNFSVVLDELQQNTTYYFRSVMENNMTGDVQYSSIHSFTTTSSDEINVFPNPFNPNKHPEHEFIYITNFPQGISFQVFNLLGEPVYSEEDIRDNVYHWRAENDHGKPVQSGLYIYIIKDEQNKKLLSGKLVILR